MSQFTLGAITGIGIGLIIMSLLVVLVGKFDIAALIDNHKTVSRVAQAGKKYTPALIAALAVLVLFAAGGAAKADTPVPLTIPTNQIFTSANDWITTFAPIAAIGIGISIALAVLGYLGSMIVKAFRS